MDLKDYIRIVARRWPSIVALTLVSLLGAAGYSLRTAPVYESSVEMFVSSPNSSTLEQYQNQLFSQQRAKSYERLLTGKDVAGQVVDALDLDLSPREFADEVSAEVVGDTVLLRATVSNTDPADAQLYARTLGEIFVRYIDTLETPAGAARSPIKLSVVAQPDLPGSPAEPDLVLNLGLGAGLGLLLGLVVAAVREFLDTSVRGVEDLSGALNIPVLGTVPFDRSVAKDPVIATLPSHHPRVESLQILRTNLQFLDVDTGIGVIAVTSSVPGEGKTTIAINLATTLALSGKRVALIEGDLRRPRVAKYMGLEESVGLTRILIGQVSVDDATQLEPISGLEVITSGPIPPNPTDMIQSDAMRKLISELQSSFDMVLIDAPPSLPVADAALLASLADGALLVVRHGKTSREHVRKSTERLLAVGAPVLGAIINMVPRGRSAERYGYYGYGYPPESGPADRSREPVTAARGPASRRTGGRRKNTDGTTAPEPSPDVGGQGLVATQDQAFLDRGDENPSGRA